MESITSTAAYPRGAVLFVEGQEPRGLFVLCHGRAKLSTSSRDGKTIILRIVGPGEVVGLSSTVSGRPYEGTAELLEPSQANFISRQDFLSFLREHGDVALKVAEQLGAIYLSAYEEIRRLGLSHSASEKLARLLLEWSSRESTNKPRLKLTLTHDEIAQMIGSSRETVTRTITDFKKKRWIEAKGSTLVIKNRPALENLIS